MYKCEWCGAEFDEPDEIPDGWFAYNPMVHLVCPECGEDQFYEMEDE